VHRPDWGTLELKTDTDASYETRSIRSLRGTEERTIKRWEDDGWEVVSQESGQLRTEIRLRRARPKPHPRRWIIGGVAVAAVLVVVITIGVISERNSSSAAPASSASTAPASAEPRKEGSPTSTTSGTPDTECADAGAFASCTFGQTVRYTGSTREGEVALEITVLDPVQFTPSSSATFTNSRAAQMPALPVNIYFPVTIKNVAPGGRDNKFIFTHATSLADDETEVLKVDDGEVKSFVDFDTLGPGESYTFNNGWSMSTQNGPKFTVSIDGLAGHSVTFTKPRDGETSD
jgi:hypothetical protein